MDCFFLGFIATTSTLTCVFLSTLWSNWNDHQVFDINLDLDNPKYVWRKTPLDLTRDSLTHSINNYNKKWLGFFLLYLRQKIKPYTSYGVRMSWKNLPKKKKNLHEFWSIESNFRSMEPCRKWTVIFYNNLIPTSQ